MRKIIFLLVAFYASFLAQINFNKYFENAAMRVDIFQAGDANEEEIFLKEIKREPYFSGSRKNLIDTLNLGYYYFYVRSVPDGKLIFSKGFSTLFQEWQSTEEAKSVRKAFSYSLRFPYPKDTVTVEIKRRGRNGKFHALFSMAIDPKSYLIKNDTPKNYAFEKIAGEKNHESALDIVFLPEGYRKSDSIKFRKDCKRFADFLFSYPPFDKAKNSINIRAVYAWSDEKGADIPGDSIYKRTLLGASFYTFDSERYLMIEDYHHLADIAACVPYDQIYVLVNTDKYGGGAIYNFYNVTCVDNPRSELVFIHEFGHGLSGLADEYYTSDVSYRDYYDLSVEPWEKNITTLVDFKSKWENLVPADVPIPTPDDSLYYGKIGVFEGGGYVAKGVYRPSHNSIMKSLKAKGFNEVCKRAILEVIGFFSK